MKQNHIVLKEESYILKEGTICMDGAKGNITNGKGDLQSHSDRTRDQMRYKVLWR